MSERVPVGADVQIVVFGRVVGVNAQGDVETESGSVIDADDIESVTVIDDSNV